MSRSTQHEFATLVNYIFGWLQRERVLARLKAIYFWYSAWFHTEDFNGCMFQKAVEEVFKIYPSTIRPALEYKEWLTSIILELLSKLEINKPEALANLLVSILDGMTMQAQIDKNAVKIDEYWTRVERLIEFEKQEQRN